LQLRNPGEKKQKHQSWLLQHQQAMKRPSLITKQALLMGFSFYFLFLVSVKSLAE